MTHLLKRGMLALAMMAGLAFAALPPWARRLYSIPELPAAAALHGAATTVALHALRASLRGVQAVVPPLRESPHRRSARERLAQGPDTENENENESSSHDRSATPQDRNQDAG